MRFRYRGHIDGITLFEAALAPAILTLPTPDPRPGRRHGSGGGRDHRPRRVRQGVVQRRPVERGGGPGKHRVQPATDRRRPRRSHHARTHRCAITVVIVTNIVTFTYAMHLVQREPIRNVLRSFAPLVPVWGFTWILNAAFGIIFAATYTWSTAGRSPSSPSRWRCSTGRRKPTRAPSWTRSVSQGSTARPWSSQRRSTRARRSRGSSARSANPSAAMRSTSSFSSGRIRTVHRVDQDGYREHDEPWELRDARRRALRAGSHGARERGGDRDPIAAALLDLEGWRDCLAAPLLDGDRTLGVLCVYNRQGLEGFERGEEAVLQALASRSRARDGQGQPARTPSSRNARSWPTSSDARPTGSSRSPRAER